MPIYVTQQNKSLYFDVKNSPLSERVIFHLDVSELDKPSTIGKDEVIVRTMIFAVTRWRGLPYAQTADGISINKTFVIDENGNELR